MPILGNGWGPSLFLGCPKRDGDGGKIENCSNLNSLRKIVMYYVHEIEKGSLVFFILKIRCIYVIFYFLGLETQFGFAPSPRVNSFSYTLQSSKS